MINIFYRYTNNLYYKFNHNTIPEYEYITIEIKNIMLLLVIFYFIFSITMHRIRYCNCYNFLLTQNITISRTNNNAINVHITKI